MSLLNGLRLYWPLEDSGKDVSGNGQDATTTTNVSFINAKVRNGASFSNGRLSRLTNIGTGVFPLSMCAWAKYNIPVVGDPVICAYTDGCAGTNRGFAFFINNTTLCYHLGFCGNQITSPVLANDNTFHFLVVSYDGTTARFYVDNILRGTFNLSINFANATFVVGSFAGLQFFNGVVDEVGLWRRALSVEEISLLWNNGLGNTYPFSNATFLLQMI